MSDREDQELDRRSFVTGALGAAAGIGVSALLAADANAQQQPPAGAPPAGGPPPDAIPVSMRRPATSYKLEADVRHCDVEGKIPCGSERRVLSRGSRSAVSPQPAQYSVRRRGPRRHVPDQERPRRLQEPLRAQRSLACSGSRRTRAVPDVPQSVDGRSEREGFEPEHCEYAHHQSPQLSARAEGG